MILGSKKIKNISNLDTEIGNLEFAVPDLVIDELTRISKANDKKKALHSMH